MDLAVRRFIAKLLYEPQGFGQDRWPPFRRKSHAVSLLAFPEDKLKLEGSSWELWGSTCWRWRRCEPNNVTYFPCVGHFHGAGVVGWEPILWQGKHPPVLALPRVFRDQIRASLVYVNRSHRLVFVTPTSSSFHLSVADLKTRQGTFIHCKTLCSNSRQLLHTLHS